MTFLLDNFQISKFYYSAIISHKFRIFCHRRERFISGELSNIWLGGEFTAGTSEFVWNSGEPVEYSNWQEGEPDIHQCTDGVCQCAVIDTTHPQWSWKAVSCNYPDTANTYVCQSHTTALKGTG